MNREYRQLVEELERWCNSYRECCVEVERYAQGHIVCKKIEELCREGRGMMDVKRPELLLALLDAYEVTRDEGMLQEVLDVVSGNMERLVTSVENVKLLSYCYHYVKEEECAVLACRILEELKHLGDRDVKMAEQVYRELVEEI